MAIRPAEMFFGFMPQTPSNNLGQNVIPYQFWDQSKARKVCPQAREFWYFCTWKCDFQCVNTIPIPTMTSHGVIRVLTMTLIVCVCVCYPSLAQLFLSRRPFIGKEVYIFMRKMNFENNFSERKSSTNFPDGLRFQNYRSVCIVTFIVMFWLQFWLGRAL